MKSATFLLMKWKKCIGNSIWNFVFFIYFKYFLCKWLHKFTNFLILIVTLCGMIKICALGHVSMASNLLPLIAYTITFECSKKRKHIQRCKDRGAITLTNTQHRTSSFQWAKQFSIKTFCSSHFLLFDKCRKY